MAWTTLSGAACGAICGFFILWIVCIRIRGNRSIWDVLLSAIIGVPLGAAVGSLVADRWATGEPSSVASVILRHAAGRSDFWSDTVYDPVHYARSDRRHSVLSPRRIDRRAGRCRDWCSRRCAQGTAQISIVLGDSNGNVASTLSRAVVYWPLACDGLVPETSRRRSSEHPVRHSFETPHLSAHSAVREGGSVDDRRRLAQ